MWSANKDDDDLSKHDSSTLNVDSLDASGMNSNKGSQDNLDCLQPTTPQRRKSSSAKRKVAITHTLSSPTIEEVDMTDSTPTTPAPAQVLDGNENIQHINTLVENTKITDGDVINVIPPLSTGETEQSTCVTSDDERKCSTESEGSTTFSTLKTPSSPQSFRRGGRLRGSAGPVFKSIFNRGSSKMQKTQSMDALNVHDDKKKRGTLKKRHKEQQLHKSATTIIQSSVDSGYPIIKSHSSCNISHEKDNHSVSSTETVSSKTSGHSSVKESVGDDGEYVISENNNGIIKTKTERKSKIFKTLKNFVGKK